MKRLCYIRHWWNQRELKVCEEKSHLNISKIYWTERRCKSVKLKAGLANREVNQMPHRVWMPCGFSPQICCGVLENTQPQKRHDQKKTHPESPPGNQQQMCGKRPRRRSVCRTILFHLDQLPVVLIRTFNLNFSNHFGSCQRRGYFSGCN